LALSDSSLARASRDFCKSVVQIATECRRGLSRFLRCCCLSCGIPRFTRRLDPHGSTPCRSSGALPRR